MSVRAVFDCMIFVQAVTNAAGPASALFQLVDDGQITLYLSPAILAEVREVLGRPKLRRKLPTWMMIGSGNSYGPLGQRVSSWTRCRRYSLTRETPTMSPTSTSRSPPVPNTSRAGIMTCST